ncbi:MAG: response regulator [Elusimicrobiota bacterium]|nr:MAG: response regulator [Elusimicrobiota bacterium]
MRTILAVDDSTEDAALLRMAFEHAGTTCRLSTVDGGEAALAYLQGEGPYADRRKHPFPDLMLLDIQMPGRDGFDVLEWVRAQKADWSRLPIIMLTTSHDLADVKRAYDLGANSFLVKPTGFAEFSGMIANMLAYWLPYNRPARLD